jgi:hypothetical protein
LRGQCSGSMDRDDVFADTDGMYENGSRSNRSGSGSGSGSGSRRSRISQAWAACQFLAVLCVYRAGRRLMSGGR